MFSTKFNFNILNLKKNNNITKGYSAVQYDGESAQIMLHFDKEAPIQYNRKAQLQVTHIFTRNKGNENVNLPITPPFNKDSMEKQKPLRSVIQNEPLYPVSFANFNALESNRKEVSSTCGVICKLPKVTSASAISPPHLSHKCPANNDSTAYSKSTKGINETSLSTTITVQSRVCCDVNTKLKSISCYETPISSLPQDFRKLIPNVQVIKDSSTTVCRSNASTNKHIQPKFKRHAEKQKIERLLNSFICSQNNIKQSSQSKIKIRCLLRKPNGDCTRKYMQHCYEILKGANSLNVNDFIWKLQMGTLVSRRISCNWLTQATRLNEITKCTKGRNSLRDLKCKKKNIDRPQDIANKLIYTSSSVTSESLISREYLQDDSSDLLVCESNFLAPTLTTKGFIGNRRVKSYFQSHPNTENIYEVVAALRKDNVTSYCSEAIGAWGTNSSKTLVEQPQNVSIYSSGDDHKSVSPCCLFYSHDCDCKICYRNYSSNMKG